MGKTLRRKNEFGFQGKMLSLAAAAKRARLLKEEGRRLVTANGSFDLLHVGHLYFLDEASRRGDTLFLGLNSDRSVRDGKGAGRPIMPEKERAALVAALVCVDYVVIVDASYYEAQNVLLRAVKPHVHVNCAEYGPPQQWIEWTVMREVGARGYAVPRRPGLATTDIIGRIKGS